MAKILITGVAGFIGSHLLSHALGRGDTVIGVDNFLTGKMSNIEAVLDEDASYPERFTLVRGDIRDLSLMKSVSQGCVYIFHEAAIGSVPWSIRDPLLAHETNLTGFLNIMEAARENSVRRVIYASSSAVYGDADGVPASEGREGSSLSPYGASKRSQEIYAQAYGECYGTESIGLRYFNVFGVRQDPNGAYAAVIPRWASAMFRGEPCTIFGDGSATRDYCHVSNIVGANFLSAEVSLPEGMKTCALNIGCGAETSLIELHRMMSDCVKEVASVSIPDPIFAPKRLGDIERSCADISEAHRLLGFEPVCSVYEGLRQLISHGGFV